MSEFREDNSERSILEIFKLVFLAVAAMAAAAVPRFFSESREFSRNRRGEFLASSANKVRRRDDKAAKKFVRLSAEPADREPSKFEIPAKNDSSNVGRASRSALVR